MVKCQEHLLCDTLGRIEKTAIGMVTEKSRPNEEPGKYQQIIAAVISAYYMIIKSSNRYYKNLFRVSDNTIPLW